MVRGGERFAERVTHHPKSLRLRSLQSVRELSNGARTKSNRVRVCLNRVRSSFEGTRINVTATLCVFADGGFRAFALADLARCEPESVNAAKPAKSSSVCRYWRRLPIGAPGFVPAHYYRVGIVVET
jgi:hypothetical protein